MKHQFTLVSLTLQTHEEGMLHMARMGGSPAPYYKILTEEILNGPTERGSYKNLVNVMGLVDAEGVGLVTHSMLGQLFIHETERERGMSLEMDMAMRLKVCNV
jgi:hypothetical protein